MTKLCIRPEVVEHGSCNAPWLERLDVISSVQRLQLQLLQLAHQDEHGHWLVPPEAVRAALDISLQQTQVLLDLLALVTDDVRPAEGSMPDTPPPIDVHRLALFLFVHQYLRDASRAETSDAWPESGNMMVEPSSPNKLTARAWGKEPGADRHDQSHHAHLPMVRQQLQEHLRLKEAILQGFSSYIHHHARTLVAIAAANPRGDEGTISAAEIDRLGFLIVAAKQQESDHHDNKQNTQNQNGHQQQGATELENLDSGGSDPMDVCDTPFAPGVKRLSEQLSVFYGVASDTRLPIDEVANCIENGILHPSGQQLPDQANQSPDISGMLSSSPPRHQPQQQSAFDALAPASLSFMSSPADVIGVHKATVVRGEDDVGSTGRIRISDCHDAVIYCLAPVQFVTLACCTDCLIVLGAVGRGVRVERCERVQIVAAARQVSINTCHDCTLYLGVNRPPLLLGDNRFVQLAPHNTAYSRLADHLNIAGIDPTVNVWDSPLTLAPDHTKHHHHQAMPMHTSSQSQQQPEFSPGTSPPATVAAIDGAPPAATLLPPEKLSFFMVPFKGGSGPLCGGPADPQPGISTGADGLNTWSALTQDTCQPSLGPFKLPSEYLAAWEEKYRGVSGVRQAVRTAQLDESSKRDLMTAIQSHFKEWMQSSGAMREVYDLARVEKEARALANNTTTSQNANS